MARPFLKWAGGKRQLIYEIEARLPSNILDCTTYVEPFIGGGSIMFHLLEKYDFENVYIADLNWELINCYRSLQSDVDRVSKHLTNMIRDFPNNKEERKEAYYSIRSEWNQNANKEDRLSHNQRCLRTAQTIFLNKTCFNGLFRLNSSGEFNVPIGDYDKPSFPSSESLIEVHEVLQRITINHSSFESCSKWVDEHTFVYFDPPYRPLSETSHFVSYSKTDFNDDDQDRLATLFRELDQKGAKLLLSNSDPKNTNPNDSFFDELYSGFNIDRVFAKRSINSKPSKRGKITELLIHNMTK